MSLPKNILVWKKILATSDGRDKIFKVIQYFAKIHLWLTLYPSSKTTLISKNLSNHFSLFRKMIRLAHVLEPLSESFELPSLNQKMSLDACLVIVSIYVSILNDLSDDVICLGKMSILDSKWIKKASPVSDRCWLLSILLDMTVCLQSLSKTPRSETKKRRLLYISMGKLMADFIFCSIDVLEIGDSINPGWQSLSGLMAALLGTFKLYLKHSTS